MNHPTDRITHTSRGALAGTRNSSDFNDALNIWFIDED